jgi:hypothetical protein
MNKLSKCLKCFNFFSVAKRMDYSSYDEPETESKCLISKESISSASIVSECTHFKEKLIEEK